jgi:hypothetical protein
MGENGIASTWEDVKRVSGLENWISGPDTLSIV